MSGGAFDYNQYHIQNMVEEIEDRLSNMGKTIKPDYYYGFEETYSTYPKDIVRLMEEAVYALKRAYIYAQRVDWYLSGDDDEESFQERLSEELEALDKESKNTVKSRPYCPTKKQDDE